MDGKSRMDQLANAAVYSHLDPVTSDGRQSSPNNHGAPQPSEMKRLNPYFVEWLMGWPAGWTSPIVRPVCVREEMASYRSALQQQLSSFFGAQELLMGKEMSNGPCVKQRVFCTIIAPNGQRWKGENYCVNPQSVCPRADMPTGVGYELCRDVCRQVGHAEVVAASLAGTGAQGATAYLEGHTYACDNCKATLKAAGVVEIIVAAPPEDA
jgi:hypothetical protein